MILIFIYYAKCQEKWMYVNWLQASDTNSPFPMLQTEVLLTALFHYRLIFVLISHWFFSSLWCT